MAKKFQTLVNKNGGRIAGNSFVKDFWGRGCRRPDQILVLWRMALDLEALPHSGFHPQVGDQQTNRPGNRKRQPDTLDRPGKGNGHEISDAKHRNSHHQLDAERSYSVPRSQYSAEPHFARNDDQHGQSNNAKAGAAVGKEAPFRREDGNEPSRSRQSDQEKGQRRKKSAANRIAQKSSDAFRLISAHETADERVGSLRESFGGDPENDVAGVNDIGDCERCRADALQNHKEEKPTNDLERPLKRNRCGDTVQEAQSAPIKVADAKEFVTRRIEGSQDVESQEKEGRGLRREGSKSSSTYAQSGKAEFAEDQGIAERDTGGREDHGSGDERPGFTGTHQECAVSKATADKKDAIGRDLHIIADGGANGTRFDKPICCDRPENLERKGRSQANDKDRKDAELDNADAGQKNRIDDVQKGLASSRKNDGKRDLPHDPGKSTHEVAVAREVPWPSANA